MTKVLILRIRAFNADKISNKIWDIKGVLGIEEKPDSDDTLFRLHEGDEDILEFGSEAAKKCAQWLAKDAFRGKQSMLLKVYYEDNNDFIAQINEALKSSIEIISNEGLDNIDYLEEYKKSIVGVFF